MAASELTGSVWIRKNKNKKVVELPLCTTQGESVPSPDLFCLGESLVGPQRSLFVGVVTHDATNDATNDAHASWLLLLMRLRMLLLIKRSSCRASAASTTVWSNGR